MSLAYIPRLIPLCVYEEDLEENAWQHIYSLA